MDKKIREKILKLFGDDFFDIVSEEELASTIDSFETNSEESFMEFITDFKEADEDHLNEELHAYGYGGTGSHSTGTIFNTCS